MNPRISIIIPTYNRAAFIAETLESVLAQTFKDFEIVVVDDGSTDETREALTNFFALPNFHYYFQENKGRSAARNFGTEKATGEFLMFLDSDDLLLPETLEILHEVAVKHSDSDVIGGRALWIDEKGALLDKQGAVGLEREFFSEKLHIEKIRKFFLVQGSYLIRKSLVQQLNGFKTHMHAGEDLDFFLRYCDISKISVIQTVLVHVRKHESNTPEPSVIEAIRNIAQENFDSLEHNPHDFPPDLVKKMKIEWQFRLADDYYVSKNNSKAREHYLKAIKIAPELIFDVKVLKLTFMTIVPPNLKEKVKTMLGRS